MYLSFPFFVCKIWTKFRQYYNYWEIVEERKEKKNAGMRPLLMSTPKVRKRAEYMTTNSENYIDLAKRLYTESKAKLNHKRTQCKHLVAQNQVLKIALVSLILVLITIIAMFLLFIINCNLSVTYWRQMDPNHAKCCCLTQWIPPVCT